MKLTKTILTIAISTIAAGALVSCTNELTDPSLVKNGANGIKLVKTPEVYAWSGSETLNSTNTTTKAATRGTDANANMWDKTWDCPPRAAEDLTPEELAELKALLSKGVETHNEIVIPFENYYVQQIYKGEDTYNTHDRCLDPTCDHVNNGTELGSGHMDKLGAWNGTYTNEWDEWKWNPETGQNDQIHHSEEAINYEHINNFNSGTNNNYPGTCGCGTQHYKTTLMTGMPTTGFGPDEQFSFHESWGTAHDYNNYYIVFYKGYYYVGFDYEAHKPDQGTHNHGEGLDIERDWNFTDWIVRITPAYPKGQTPVVDPEDPKDENCDKCGHPKHDDEDYCDECEEGEICHPGTTGGEEEFCPNDRKCEHGPEAHIDGVLVNGRYVYGCSICGDNVGCNACPNDNCGDPLTSHNEDGSCDDCEEGEGCTPPQGELTQPSTPSNPNKGYKHNNEVEVNFELVDSHKNPTGGNKYGNIEDLATKLSIHVRHATDVEIKIPIPASYVIDSDDLYIFNEHDVTGVYGGELQNGVTTLTYNIYQKEDGSYKTVTLNVKVVVNPEGETRPFNEGYILVWTDGIDEEVIDWCMKHNGDGINFEVWTYFNQLAGNTRDGLKSYLNQSVIRFINSDPEYYINAFGYDYEDGTWGQQHKPNDPINPDDCHVTPVDNSYTIKNTGTHLNGTPYNDIYTKGNKQPDHAHSQTN